MQTYSPEICLSHRAVLRVLMWLWKPAVEGVISVASCIGNFINTGGSIFKEKCHASMV